VDEAAAVAARLRAMPGVEKALKGVIRASWSLTDNWVLMRSKAVALIDQIEPSPKNPDLCLTRV
jgi:hypothetical protein